RVLVTGTTVFAASSLVGGFAGDAGILVAARMTQGLGAAMMLPAALSLLTTMFHEGRDRNTALGAWGGVAGLASAAGVFLGGVLTAPDARGILAAHRWCGGSRRDPVPAHVTYRHAASDRRRRRPRRGRAAAGLASSSGRLVPR